MFGSTLKRSAATLGVLAGLLAAAAPASAQILDGPVLVKAGPQAPEPSLVVIDLNDPFFRPARHATRARGRREGVKDNGVPLETRLILTFKGEVIGLEPAGGRGKDSLRGEAIDIIP